MLNYKKTNGRRTLLWNHCGTAWANKSRKNVHIWRIRNFSSFMTTYGCKPEQFYGKLSSSRPIPYINQIWSPGKNSYFLSCRKWLAGKTDVEQVNHGQNKRQFWNPSENLFHGLKRGRNVSSWTNIMLRNIYVNEHKIMCYFYSLHIIIMDLFSYSCICKNRMLHTKSKKNGILEDSN